MEYNSKSKKIDLLDYILKEDPKQDYNAFFNFLYNNLKSQQLDYFVDCSIFEKKKYDKYKKEFCIKYPDNLNKLEKSCIGSMLGMAIGDAMGARVEFLPLNYKYNQINDMGNTKKGNFSLQPGQWTDDTSMGLCIADSLIEKKGKFVPRDIMMRFILWWFFGYNNAFRYDKERSNKHSVGLGGNIAGSLYEYVNQKGKNVYTQYGNKDTSGNGSIMRNAAIPLCFFRNENEALTQAKNQSLITHQGDEAAGCCQLLTYIIVKILNLKIGKKMINEYCEIKTNFTDIDENNNKITLKDILNNLSKFKCDYESVNILANSKQEKNDKDRNWNWKDTNFKYSEKRVQSNPGYIGSYCMDGLSMALHVLYTTDSFQNAIIKAVNLCGDADSVGSVVGQIAGAFYELDAIPKEWIGVINYWDHQEIPLRGYILCHLNEANGKNEIYYNDNNLNNNDNNREKNNKKQNINFITNNEKRIKGNRYMSNKENKVNCCYIY